MKLRTTPSGTPTPKTDPRSPWRDPVLPPYDIDMDAWPEDAAPDHNRDFLRPRCGCRGWCGRGCGAIEIASHELRARACGAGLGQRAVAMHYDGRGRSGEIASLAWVVEHYVHAAERNAFIDAMSSDCPRDPFLVDVIAAANDAVYEDWCARLAEWLATAADDAARHEPGTFWATCSTSEFVDLAWVRVDDPRDGQAHAGDGRWLLACQWCRRARAWRAMGLRYQKAVASRRVKPDLVLRRAWPWSRSAPWSPSYRRP